MLPGIPKPIVLKAGLLLLLLLFLLLACSLRLNVCSYQENSPKLKTPLRLALITDLHGCRYGQGQKELLAALAEQQPDLICLSGDIIDDKNSPEGAWELLSAIGEEYPCYYASGNHEFRTEQIELLKEKIRSYGVEVLEGAGKFAEIKGQRLYIAGVDDPSAFAEGYLPGSWQAQLDAAAAGLGEEYSILLSHRPERTAAYESSGFDLVLSGHAHGGQVRIPGLVNGLYAPHQGPFPKYAGGQYPLGETSLVVSRGLCKSWLPRVFNRPELVIIELLPGE